jgi:hypothetical protein
LGILVNSYRGNGERNRGKPGQGANAMMQGIQGHDGLKRHINDDLNRGSSIVTQLIGGLALGGGVGAVVTAGGGLLPGAVIGAILGVVAPSFLTRITKRRSQEDSKN